MAEQITVRDDFDRMGQMVNSKNIIILSLILIAGVVAFFWFYQSDASKIKKRFETLAEQADKKPDETELSAALKARSISKMFDKTVYIRIPSYSISKSFAKSDMPANVMAARERYADISIQFYDLNIKFPKDGLAAVHLTASVNAELTSGEPVNEVHKLNCTLKKIDRDWFFSKIVEVKVPGESVPAQRALPGERH